MPTFKPTKTGQGYFVFEGETYLGVVEKVSLWTVRGSRTVWKARAKGKYINSGSTRKEAVEILKSLA